MVMYEYMYYNYNYNQVGLESNQIGLECKQGRIEELKRDAVLFFLFPHSNIREMNIHVPPIIVLLVSLGIKIRSRGR